MGVWNTHSMAGVLARHMLERRLLAVAILVPWLVHIPSVASAQASPSQFVKADTGFAYPENLVYDAQGDVYLVANVNGDPFALDGNGYISKLAPDGRVLASKWIDGSKPGTRLDGPKGLAIHGDTLSVADIGMVRLFNRRTGASLGAWPVRGQLMNDVAFAADGTLYVTDSGGGGEKPDTADHGAIWHFTAPAHAVAVAKGSDLSTPDGLMVSDRDIVYATFGANRIVRISKSGARSTVATMPGAKLDGLRRLPDGSYLVTSWDTKSVIRVMPNGSRRTEISDVEAPAGVAYDSKRKQLGITSMTGNRFYLIALK